MEKPNTLLKQISTVLLIFIVASGLLNSELFYNSTAFAYYAFCSLSFIFTITVSFLHTTNKKSLNIKIPLLLFGLWCCYVLVHYFTNTGTLVFTIYCICLYFLLLKTTTLFSVANFNYTFFFIGIAIIASIESFYCIGQFFGWVKSQNKLFSVTGSWNNPNVIAIFLALTTPIFLFLFQSKFKKISLMGFITLLVALLLLKCRTALIGTILSFVVFYGLEHNFIGWVKDKKNRSSAKALLILSLLFIIPISSLLYKVKQDSADGRKFIWKLSAQMSTEKPLIGYGYGYFEKEYNLYQANYIKQGKATTEELTNAGPVIMPHNELLQNAVEGGSIGLLLILLFFGSILLTFRRSKINQNNLNTETDSHSRNNNFNLAYTGIVSFIAMSMINSTMQIVPVMCLCIVYTSIICSGLKESRFFVNLVFIPNKTAFSILSKTGILITSLYLSYLIFGIASADGENKKAKLLKEAGQYEQALQIMPNLEPFLKEDPNYWKNYGAIYFEKHLYREALVCFKKAKMRSTLPDIYYGTGICYERLKQYPEAVSYTHLTLPTKA